MARKYISPVIMSSETTNPTSQAWVIQQSIRDQMKEDLSTSFVYGDNNYEEEYVVPDVVEEIASSDSGSEEAGE